MAQTEREEQQQLDCGRYVIALLTALLHKTAVPPLPEGLSWEQVYQTAKRHTLDAMVFAAAAPMLKDEPELRAKWSRRRDKTMAQTLTQMGEEPQLLAAFSQAGLKALPVKGSALRGLYPSPDFRQMSDIDLTIPPEQMMQAAQLLESRGYQCKDENFPQEHEGSFEQPPFLCVELHDSPVKPDDPRAGYYQSIWEKAVPDPALPGIFRLKPEDEYLYLLVHFLQHYEDAGIGIRQVMDVYLFRQSWAGKMDAAYLEREAREMGIQPMRDAIEQLADFSFSGQPGEPDPDIREMQDFCILSGIYGSHRSRSIAIMRKVQAGDGRGGKAKYILRRLFPPKDELYRRYPQARNTPWLLPWYWLRRLLDVRYWKEHFGREMGALFQKK